jgi:hypothetical protein
MKFSVCPKCGKEPEYNPKGHRSFDGNVLRHDCSKESGSPIILFTLDQWEYRCKEEFDNYTYSRPKKIWEENYDNLTISEMKRLVDFVFVNFPEERVNCGLHGVVTVVIKLLKLLDRLEEHEKRIRTLEKFLKGINK